MLFCLIYFWKGQRPLSLCCKIEKCLNRSAHEWLLLLNLHHFNKTFNVFSLVKIDVQLFYYFNNCIYATGKNVGKFNHILSAIDFTGRVTYALSLIWWKISSAAGLGHLYIRKKTNGQWSKCNLRTQISSIQQPCGLGYGLNAQNINSFITINIVIKGILYFNSPKIDLLA